MDRIPLPNVPWQLTGNHWLALPCIHPATGAIHRMSVLHRGARAALEFVAADADTESAAPLLRPVMLVDGEPTALGAGGMAWERALGWLPTFTCTVGSLLVRGMVFCPFGRDADMAGAVYTFAIENRGTKARTVTLALEGQGGALVPRVRRARPSAGRLQGAVADGVVVLDPGVTPGLAAFALAADGEGDVSASPDGGSRLARTVTIAPGQRDELAFYLAAGPECDGAIATSAAMRRRGWQWLLSATRDALTALQQSTGSDSLDRLVNQNLLFAYFYAVGRALDDAHFYLMRTRVPWHPAGVTMREWDALMMTLPAVQLADPGLARELLLRMCELHGYAPGRGTHYFDGTMFEPAFSLEGAAAYVLAVDRYAAESKDEQIVDDPVLADTLYLVNDELAERRHAEMPLYSTEIAPSGAVPPLPYTAHANGVAAVALDILRRTLDEETARDVPDGEAVRVALQRNFERTEGGKKSLCTALDLAGAASRDDDAVGSLLWLPMYGAIDADDAVFKRSARALATPTTALSTIIARLCGPDSVSVLEWLRRAPLDGGVAAEFVDGDGRAMANGGDASLAGLLAATVCWLVRPVAPSGS
ncbi:MAG: hypothetical protein U5K74_05030 [Gemmatimonadaceae bacterium]|nr:hypothetical protein [Gemmatimonadaceae bacterium]